MVAMLHVTSNRPKMLLPLNRQLGLVGESASNPVCSKDYYKSVTCKIGDG